MKALSRWDVQACGRGHPLWSPAQRYSQLLCSASPVSSACVHGVRCGDGSCVGESQECDGLPHCPAGRDEADGGTSLLFLLYPDSLTSPRCPQ